MSKKTKMHLHYKYVIVYDCYLIIVPIILIIHCDMIEWLLFDHFRTITIKFKLKMTFIFYD